ncbi:MAG TPA: response regulator transcription factor [Micromonosporaceae bacterium]|nr:response regulator transcription factor [Micromonosporaceae bacterium]
MRLILAEDSTLLREGLARLLTAEGHEVLAAVADGTALVDAVEQHQPDLAVADVRMPPTHTDEGLRAALTIRRRWPAVGILVLSQYVERRYATELLTAGTDGVGYLLKDRVVQVDDFLDALARVAAGGTVLDPEVVRRLITQSSHTHPLNRLTNREHQVLAAMAEGCTNAAIAARLHLSQSAVEKHGNAIFDKLRLTDATGYNRRVLAILHYLRS